MSLSLSTLKVVSVRFFYKFADVKIERYNPMLNSHIFHHICTHNREMTLSFGGNFVLVSSSSALSMATSETSLAFALLPAAVTSYLFFAKRRLKKPLMLP